MSFKKNLLALCLTGLFLIPALQPSYAQTAEVSTSGTAAIEFVSNPGPFLDGKIGTVPYDRWSEEHLTYLTNMSCNCKVKKYIYNNSVADCLAMIKSGRADFLLTTDVTAAYMAQRNHDLKAVVDPGPLGVVMILRSSDAALKDSFDTAIKKLKENGKLGELENKWIKDLPVGKEPSMNKIEKVSGAETVYVGVSGDMPPLDYVAADGKPAGFNIALLTEISKLIGKNIEIISLDSQARFTALDAKKVDVFFWVVIPYDKVVQDKLKDDPSEQAFFKKYSYTEPHCVVKTGFVFKK